MHSFRNSCDLRSNLVANVDNISLGLGDGDFEAIGEVNLDFKMSLDKQSDGTRRKVDALSILDEWRDELVKVSVVLQSSYQTIGAGRFRQLELVALGHEGLPKTTILVDVSEDIMEASSRNNRFGELASILLVHVHLTAGLKVESIQHGKGAEETVGKEFDDIAVRWIGEFQTIIKKAAVGLFGLDK